MTSSKPTSLISRRQKQQLSSISVSSNNEQQQQQEQQQQEQRPPTWKVWLIASRPHTLTASISPIIVAYNVGMVVIDDLNHQKYRLLTVEWMVFCVFMQLGTNLHNDYADFVKGADTDKRVGQPRATQRGWLTPSQTATASGLILAMGFALGVSFIYNIVVSEGNDHRTRNVLIMTLIVTSSVFNAFAYTGGPWPLGYIGLSNISIAYSGLGDVFAFLYFGLVATMTLPFLYYVVTTTNETPLLNKHTQQQQSSLSDVLYPFVPYAIQVAVLVTNIIVVNNLRDRHTDVLVDKRTLPVRYGAKFCHLEYLINLEVAYGLVVCQSLSSSSSSLLLLLPLLTVPLAYKEWKAVCTKEGSALNEHVGGAAKVQLLFCILVSISIRVSANN
jgi:1,4-dihydroxy-2-naphthoate octaprenyltransferase